MSSVFEWQLTAVWILESAEKRIWILRNRLSHHPTPPNEPNTKWNEVEDLLRGRFSIFSLLVIKAISLSHSHNRSCHNEYSIAFATSNGIETKKFWPCHSTKLWFLMIMKIFRCAAAAVASAHSMFSFHLIYSASNLLELSVLASSAGCAQSLALVFFFYFASVVVSDAYGRALDKHSRRRKWRSINSGVTFNLCKSLWV